MVRSYWIGSVFGVVALTGLAWGQATFPVPGGAGESKDRYVTVQEPGKPGQRCKILKTWTEPDGVPAFQAQALDTGELITIEETDSAAPRPGALVRSASMRIFHWGRTGPVPMGTPEPPANALVVGYPIDIHPRTPEPSRIASVPAPSPQPSNSWPSAFAETRTAELNAGAEHRTPPPPPVMAPMAQAAPPARKVELSPMPPTPQVANLVKGAPAASGPTVVASPYIATVKPASPVAPPSATWTATKPDGKPAPAVTVAKNSDVKPLGAASSVWKPSVAPAAPPAPPAPPKESVVAKKVDTTPAPPPDWRQPWGKVDMPAPPVPGKSETPHAQPRTDDPLKTPDKFVKAAHTGAFDAAKPAPENKAPLPTALAPDQPPALPKMEAKQSEPHAPPTLPALPGPTLLIPPVPPAAVSLPPLPPVPTPVVKLDPAPAATAPKPAVPTVPLGLGSVAAAASPELAPPAAPAPKAAAPGKDEIGLRADEPNAFTGRPSSGAVASAPNAFSAPPLASPPPDAVASNAFPHPPQVAPSYAPAAVAMRSQTRPTATAPQRATGYVVPAGFQQESGYNLSQLSGILRDSLYPSQREWAAESLASMDWHRQPQIVDLLVERAKQDPAPAVRAECLRSLGRMKADTPAAVETIKALRSDSDDCVRQEADEAYHAVSGAASH